MSFFAHPTAVIDDGAEIGDGTKVWHFCHISTGARIGRDCVLGQNVFVAPGVVIGDGCKIQNNVSVYTGVELEDEVFIGPAAVFTNVQNPRAFVERKHLFGKTIVHRGASIGANSTIVCPCDIGAYAFVAAGAVVTKDVAEYALMVGVPARAAGRVCRCGEVERDGGCPACGAVA